MNEQEKKELYLQFKPMLHKYSNKCSMMHGIDAEECFSEACLLFAKSCTTYKKDIACFSTHLHNNLFCNLNKYANKIYTTQQQTESYDDLEYVLSAPASKLNLTLELEDKISKLSVLAQKIIASIFSDKIYPKTERLTRKKIIEYFTEQGYAKYKIKRTFCEIKQIL